MAKVIWTNKPAALEFLLQRINKLVFLMIILVLYPQASKLLSTVLVRRTLHTGDACSSQVDYLHATPHIHNIQPLSAHLFRSVHGGHYDKCRNPAIEVLWLAVSQATSATATAIATALVIFEQHNGSHKNTQFTSTLGQLQNHH